MSAHEEQEQERREPENVFCHSDVWRRAIELLKRRWLDVEEDECDS